MGQTPRLFRRFTWSSWTLVFTGVLKVVPKPVGRMICDLPFPPRVSLVQNATYNVSGSPPSMCSAHPRPCPNQLLAILWKMSPQRLYNLDRSSTEFSQQLYELLREKEYVDELQKLPEGELVQLVNYLNSVRYL